MTMQLGMTISKPNQVCELIKSLYGLKIAGIKWCKKHISLLISHQFHHVNLDHSLFSRKLLTRSLS